MNQTSEIIQIADTLTKMHKKIESDELDKLQEAAEYIGTSWSGSWLGYHSTVYYKGFRPVPHGTRFNIEWGLMDTTFISDCTVGEWEEYAFDKVVSAIQNKAGNPDLNKYDCLVEDAKNSFEESQSRLLSIFSTILSNQADDKFLEDLINKVKETKIFSPSDFVGHLAPSGQQVSRDSRAIYAGIKTPPHISIIAQVTALHSPFRACKDLSKLASQAASHIKGLEKMTQQKEHIGIKVFIGHGQSKIWKDLKDFIQDRLHLPWDEFNRVPIAGISNKERLSRMMNDAAMAFVIMTAEDEQVDGKVHARMNVVHEAGLFQGRLGFERAIILIEEGCEAFSNIDGLGQLRFPKGKISAIFEDIRKVLEREKLIE